MAEVGRTLTRRGMLAAAVVAPAAPAIAGSKAAGLDGVAGQGRVNLTVRAETLGQFLAAVAALREFG